MYGTERNPIALLVFCKFTVNTKQEQLRPIFCVSLVNRKHFKHVIFFWVELQIYSIHTQNEELTMTKKVQMSL